MAHAQAEAGKTESASDSNTTEIYIGFVKEEGFGDRSGKKGRIVKDDPRKYPDRSEITGGWAGGEAGLWKLREEIAVRHTCASQPQVRRHLSQSRLLLLGAARTALLV